MKIKKIVAILLFSVLVVFTVQASPLDIVKLMGPSSHGDGTL